MPSGELLGKLIPNAISAVAVIVVVYMFLNRQKEERVISKEERKEFIEAMDVIRTECHERTEKAEAVFQDHIQRIVSETSKVANGYHEAMQTFAGAIAKNGEILEEVRDELRIERRGQGRRGSDWEAQKKEA